MFSKDGRNKDKPCPGSLVSLQPFSLNPLEITAGSREREVCGGSGGGGVYSTPVAIIRSVFSLSAIQPIVVPEEPL